MVTIYSLFLFGTSLLFHFQLFVGNLVLSWKSRGMWASLVGQMVKNLPAMLETWVWSLGWEDPLEEGMETHSNILAWREEPGGLQPMGLQRVRQDWVTKHTGQGHVDLMGSILHMMEEIGHNSSCCGQWFIWRGIWHQVYECVLERFPSTWTCEQSDHLTYHPNHNTFKSEGVPILMSGEQI